MVSLRRLGQSNRSWSGAYIVGIDDFFVFKEINCPL